MPTTLGGPVGSAVNGITWLVYRSIQAVTRTVGGGIDLALTEFEPVPAGPGDSSPRREAVVAALNGVLGDHLADTGNPLAIAMRVRSGGKPVELTGAGLAAAFPRPDEDWQGRDRFAHANDIRRPVPLPDGVSCFTVAATKGKVAHDLRCRLVGDGLVPLASALGRHADPRFALAFPEAHQWVACDTGHVELLDQPAVYERIRDWLAG